MHELIISQTVYKDQIKYFISELACVVSQKCKNLLKFQADVINFVCKLYDQMKDDTN